MIKRHQHHPTEHPHPNGDRSPEAGSDPLQGLSRDPEGVLVAPWISLEKDMVPPNAWYFSGMLMKNFNGTQ